MIEEAKAQIGKFNHWIVRIFNFFFYLVCSMCGGVYLSAIALDTTRGQAYSQEENLYLYYKSVQKSMAQEVIGHRGKIQLLLC